MRRKKNGENWQQRNCQLWKNALQRWIAHSERDGKEHVAQQLTKKAAPFGVGISHRARSARSTVQHVSISFDRFCGGDRSFGTAAVTTANKITIARILMIPVFVTLAVYYGDTVQADEPAEWLRYAAIAVFLLASASDGLDGYLARHYNQRSKLGVILDPIADKGLLLTAIITLSFSDWHYQFPAWFPILVVARDLVIVIGAAVLHMLNGTVEVQPSWTGKIATVTQMIAIGWVMLQFPHLIWPVAVAAFFTLVSGIGYFGFGLRQLADGGHSNAERT